MGSPVPPSRERGVTTESPPHSLTEGLPLFDMAGEADHHADLRRLLARLEKRIRQLERRPADTRLRQVILKPQSENPTVSEREQVNAFRLQLMAKCKRKMLTCPIGAPLVIAAACFAMSWTLGWRVAEEANAFSRYFPSMLILSLTLTLLRWLWKVHSQTRGIYVPLIEVLADIRLGKHGPQAAGTKVPAGPENPVFGFVRTLLDIHRERAAPKAETPAKPGQTSG